LGRYVSSLDSEPEELEQLNGRIAQLQAVARKYGSIDQAIEERDRVSKLLSSIEDSGQDEKEIRKELEAVRNELRSSAKELTDQRTKGAKKFARQVAQELKFLGMESADLKVEFTPVIEEGGFGPAGAEGARILFAPNPGEGFKPLSKIASGGELSRVLLAMKSVSIRQNDDADITYLFDEVDAGIGGETAERVGMRLKTLSSGGQVLCVTHLAQIACYASLHLNVQKEQKGGRTHAIVNSLEDKEKTRELARMIGGIRVSQKALDHAGELLQRARTQETMPLTHA
jgi:DNA repair protein RecN (Recombination protein N)